jgi:ribosomal protein S18 acetylase RimI-like enzyme
VSKHQHTISIRDARLSDAAAIAHVRVAAWRLGYRGLIPDSYLNRPDFEQLQALHLQAALHDITDEVRISVAEVAGKIVGYCAYGACGDSSSQPSQAGIYDLFVHPQAWHCGVGRKLLTCATEHLNAQGFVAASLFVYEANTRGRAFYQQAGWEADGHRELDQRPEFALPVLRYRKVFSY